MAPSTQQLNSSLDAQARQQTTIHKQQAELSRMQAEQALAHSQIEALKKQIHADMRTQHLMQKRLTWFDDVLEARTVKGVHILHPEAQWIKEQNLITYQLVLVKGENYPRWALGHMAFTTHTDDGKILRLKNTKGQSAIKYEMTTHKYLQGTLAWHSKDQPSTLHLTLINNYHKKIRQADFPITIVNSTSNLGPRKE
ncbi:MAG: hypothetical protein Q9M31_08585 [Mariprofundus sp.]|nr:hypothetical protein [Mariprofundus sp.]